MTKSKPVKLDPSHMQMSTLDNHLYCYHCGDDFKVGLCLPVRIELMELICKAFQKVHKKCKESDRGRDLKLSHLTRWEEWCKINNKSPDGSDTKITVTIG